MDEAPQDTVELEVGESLEGVRVDRALALVLEVPRGRVEELLTSGQVELNGLVESHRARRLRRGDRLRVTLLRQEPASWVAGAITILHEDSDVAVVDKPAGVLVHPVSPRDERPSVVGALLACHPGLAQVGDDPLRPGVFQRLDLDTSGVLAIALDETAFRALKSQAAARALGRRYLALVEGVLPFDEGTVDAPLGREPRGMAVDAGGREAITHVRVRERFASYTLVEARLETGRTHQIRVHMAAIGHPLVGDARYGAPTPLLVGRHFLHATALDLEHPRTHMHLHFESSLPKELEAVLTTLRG
jgi:23S rRNA pseudouridine1911/1915/1917 synthase